MTFSLPELIRRGNLSHRLNFIIVRFCYNYEISRKQVFFFAQERIFETARRRQSAKEALVAKNLIAKPEALRLKRMDAELTGKRGEYIANMARVRQQRVPGVVQSVWPTG